MKRKPRHYSSASNYINDNTGLIVIEKADNPIVDVLGISSPKREKM